MQALWGMCDKEQAGTAIGRVCSGSTETAALQKKKEKREDSDIKGWEAHLVASALGEEVSILGNESCPETVAGNIRMGYRWFEADIN
ncbi:MAG: hypothetical protein ACLR0U_16990 [Enterocloster clostridioformis]